MDRRSFLRGLLAGSAAVMATERVYSFLTNNPLARNGYEFRLASYSNLLVSEPGRVMLFDQLLKELYSDDEQMIMANQSPLLGIVAHGSDFIQ